MSPAELKVRENVHNALDWLFENEPSSAATLCSPPVLVQRTVSPTLMVTSFGVYRKLLTAISIVAACSMGAHSSANNKAAQYLTFITTTSQRRPAVRTVPTLAPR